MNAHTMAKNSENKKHPVITGYSAVYSTHACWIH